MTQKRAGNKKILQKSATILIILIIFLTGTSSLLLFFTSPQELQPFSSDGCSMFPDGDFNNPNLWLDCCTTHDYAYWQGGSKKDKEKSDLELELCIADRVSPTLGKMMNMTVSITGNPYLPTWFRWGYGWPYPRGYKGLTVKEREELQMSTTNATNTANTANTNN